MTKTTREKEIAELAAQFEAEDIAAQKAVYRDRAERRIAANEAAARVVVVQARDPADLQAILNDWPDGTNWNAARSTYWVEKYLDLRGRGSMDINLGGAKVAVHNYTEGSPYLTDSPAVRVFNGNFDCGVPIK